MKICFLARPSFDRFSVALYKKMVKDCDNSLEAVFITSNESESNYIATEIPGANICETSKFIRINHSKYSKKLLDEYEKKYECAPIWKYIYSDRFLVNRKYEYVVDITCGLFDFFETVFKNGDVDFYYSETIATLQCYIAYIVGKKYDVKYVAQMCARGNLDSTYHYFVSDEFQHNALFNEDYMNCNYTEEEWDKAEEYLSGFEYEESRPPAMADVVSLPRINKNFFAAPIRWLVQFLDKENHDPYSYIYYKSYNRMLNPIMFWYRYNKIKKVYASADFDNKYIYYPLHCQPEASTCVCAEKYEKQLFYIDSLAKSIPADTVLYVKEHYALLGHRDLQFYKEMRKYPNVVLIDPFTSSRNLIEHSCAVATLTGTAGLEAVLLGKPVILGGDTVFDNAPGIMKIKDIYDNYISNICNWKKPEREKIKKYLCACFRSYYPGNAYAQNFYHYIPDNIDLLGESLYSYLKNCLKNRILCTKAWTGDGERV